MTWSRSRIGIAWTPGYPISFAAAANCGHRDAVFPDIADDHRLPAAVAVQAGPLIVLIWNSSTTLAYSVEAATSRRAPRLSASRSPHPRRSLACHVTILAPAAAPGGLPR